MIWQTDRYATNTLNSGHDDNTTTANATETVYNSLGQVVATYRMSGVLITLGTDPNAGGDTSLEESTLANQGTQISVTSTVYNAAGQAVETVSPSGLRTGTIYNPDGSVEYTGPLDPSASASWYLSANPTGAFMVDPSSGRQEFTQYLYNQLDTSSNPWNGLLYDSVIDNDGHNAGGSPAADVTDTYKDSSGRTLFTVYDDGSYTQMIYSVGDQAITSDSAISSIRLYTIGGHNPARRQRDDQHCPAKDRRSGRSDDRCLRCRRQSRGRL